MHAPIPDFYQHVLKSNRFIYNLFSIKKTQIPEAIAIHSLEELWFYRAIPDWQSSYKRMVIVLELLSRNILQRSALWLEPNPLTENRGQ